MAINRVGAKGIASCTVAAQDIEDASLTNANFGPSTISNSQLANSSVTINGTSVSLGGSISLPEPPDWQAVTVADGSTQLTATAGKGYFLDTNTGVIEVFLPTSPSRGDFVVLVDYSGTFGTNQAIVNTGGKNIDSTTGSEFKLTTNNTIAYFVYVDAAKGWLVYLNQAAGTTPTVTGNEIGGGYDNATFIQATGGTITTDGNFKIHTFTGDGTFSVSAIGNSQVPTAYRAKVDYLVVAGGGGGGGFYGGAGAGGFRESCGSAGGCYSTSPLKAACSAITVAASPGSYPVTVGGGGAEGDTANPGTNNGSSGSNSVFSTITSTGGGFGSGVPSGPAAGNGGSGGGEGYANASGAGSGNTPPVSPPQGNNGGTGAPGEGGGGGGGGATAAGGSSSPPFGSAGAGGAGATTSISGSSTAYAGGGGGGSASPPCASLNNGGAGGGGSAKGANTNTGEDGTANTGGGGAARGGTGGKGVVIIRYKFQ